MPDFAETLKIIMENLASFLTEKNKRYGNSALEPLEIFSKGSDGIPQRIDDKLARIKNSDELRKNDITDLTGYLILLMMQKDWTNFNELID